MEQKPPTDTRSVSPENLKPFTSPRRIKQMLVDDWAQHGRSGHRIQEHFATQEDIAKKIEERKWGYAGWLVLNPEFRKECSEFRHRWEPWIRANGAFPAYPSSFLGHSPAVPKETREFYDDYTQFYQRWCLHTFVTWDLPVPMWAGIATPIFYPLAQASPAGLALFIPWYLLRDQTFKLQDLAKHERFAKGPDHLQDWFGMLKVYIYFELCLKRRYADRFEGRIEKLDRALGHFLCESTTIDAGIRYKEENVEKIRKEMNRRLKSCLPLGDSSSIPRSDGGVEQEPRAQADRTRSRGPERPGRSP